MILDKVNGVVPEQGVVEQNDENDENDENAAVQGSGEMVNKGNGTEIERKSRRKNKRRSAS